MRQAVTQTPCTAPISIQVYAMRRHCKRTWTYRLTSLTKPDISWQNLTDSNRWHSLMEWHSAAAKWVTLSWRKGARVQHTATNSHVHEWVPCTIVPYLAGNTKIVQQKIFNRCRFKKKKHLLRAKILTVTFPYVRSGNYPPLVNNVFFNHQLSLVSFRANDLIQTESKTFAYFPPIYQQNLHSRAMQNTTSQHFLVTHVNLNAIYSI